MLSNHKRHYLAEFYGGYDDKHARFRKTNLVARALYPKAGVKSFASLQVRIVGLHERGAILQSSAIEFLPEHFYLCLGDGEIFITCARKSVDRADMFVSFSQAEDTGFIEALTKIAVPLSTLRRMRGQSPLPVEARIVRHARAN